MSDRCQAMTGEIAAVIGAMAEGDMKRRLTRDYPGIFGQLKTGANAMAERLTDIARRLGETAHTVSDASGEISTGSRSDGHHVGQGCVSTCSAGWLSYHS